MTEFSEDDFYQMMKSIKKRPGMYLGTADINLLYAFLVGFNLAHNMTGAYKPKSQTSLFPLKFWFMHEFAKVKKKAGSSVAGWKNIILSECGNDPRVALDRFFEYYDEFCTLKAKSIKKAVLSEKNILANDNMLYTARVSSFMTVTPSNGLSDDNDELFGNKSPIYDSPQAVYVIELSGGNGFLCCVETASDIQLINHIFYSIDEIIGDEDNYDSPERVFGPITTLTEIECSDNPDFGKPVH